jgi:hypothetical protein
MSKYKSKNMIVGVGCLVVTAGLIAMTIIESSIYFLGPAIFIGFAGIVLIGTAATEEK